ncbi:hypothetical protein HMPREF3038_01943 [Akkermansia sp. KLE1797]|nr:hypothetical protein HMPREF3038_01943 [Akkermansia sp. KLE1797]KXU54668.1 hypothetical protein HMPREF3039_01140 [Akkermansia sp. KLE1798]KZA06012.1 hypothetical protein HMPREF1326_00275 [Akkermansia sp. KLE1605]
MVGMYVNRDCFLTGRRLAVAARESMGETYEGTIIFFDIPE